MKTFKYATLSTSIVAQLVLLANVSSAKPTLELYIQGPGEMFMGDPESTSIDADGYVHLGLQQKPIDLKTDKPILFLSQKYSAGINSLWAASLKQIFNLKNPQKPIDAEGVLTALHSHKNNIWFSTANKATLFKLEGKKAKSIASIEAQYIWDILNTSEGLMVATGLPGELLKLGKRGKTKVVFSSSETHLKVIRQHPSWGTILGGGQEGIVYHLNKQGKVRALYDSEYEEVTDIVFDHEGSAYVTIVGAKAKASRKPGKKIAGYGDDNNKESPFKGSEVIRIKRDGQVAKLWTSEEEGALTLVFDKKTRQIFFGTATGPKGKARVYSIQLANRDRLTVVGRLNEPMLTSLALSPKRELIASTAPHGNLYVLGPNLTNKGVYLSIEQDLGRVSKIGRLWFDADIPKGSRINLYLRTGNTKQTDETWSSWSQAVTTPEGSAIQVPQGKYAQFKAEIIQNKGKTPILKSMHASVVRSNLPPIVKKIIPLRSNLRIKHLHTEPETTKTMTLSANTIKQLRQIGYESNTPIRMRVSQKEGAMSIVWQAVDPDNDPMLYEAHLIRKDGFSVLLQENLKVPFTSFDSKAHRDGEYRVKVIATDRPGNRPGLAMTDSLESQPFTIDNTPPKVVSLKASSKKQKIIVSAVVSDEHSRLGRAQVSLDGGPWLLLPAVDGFLDQKTEKLSVTLDAKKGNHSVAIQIYDQAYNTVRAAINQSVR